MGLKGVGNCGRTDLRGCWICFRQAVAPGDRASGFFTEFLVLNRAKLMSNDDGRREELKRRRLKQAFEHAKKQMAMEEYDFGYVCDLLSQCVLGEPSDTNYMQAFLENLHKKYKNNLKGVSFAALSTAPAKSGVKKALAGKDWDNLVKHALEVFKLNPWDTTALTAMASMCELRNFAECELKYLKSALAASPKDPEINKQCALALARRRMLDEAIACWHRVEKARPDAEEPPRMIAELAVLKNRGKFNAEEAASRTTSSGRLGGGEQEMAATPEQKLMMRIKKDPQQLSNYVELAQMLMNQERFKETEQWLTKALALAKDDLDLREKLYDAQSRHLQQQIKAADKQRKSGDEKATLAYKQLRRKYAELDLEVYKFRCDRYPNNLNFKYFLGVAYQHLGHYNEAIKEFQVARADPRRKGECLLALGQCFQHIKQVRLAMNHYSQAVEEIPERDADNKKLALYLAGRLALGLKDTKAAEKYLGELAQLDFAYKDVSTLLDKLEALGNDNGSPDGGSPPDGGS
jgi:tetratricopeptide (TPR) repeat protein